MTNFKIGCSPLTSKIYAGHEVIIKKPSNIKSIENDGTWDVNDNNIYS
jgi:hypothetical protein